MALLQDPTKAIEQAKWYLDNASVETFPGAFELAAGNLCRQTLEQALFILCFYSRMPRQKYLRPDRTLKTAGALVRQLDTVQPSSGMTYWRALRVHRANVAKFAKKERSLKRWARDLNEPSHFALRFRKLRSQEYRAFITFARGVFDTNDRLMIIAAVNELFSNGRLWVQLDDKDNHPVVYRRQVVRMKDFVRTPTGQLSVSSPKWPFRVIPNNEVPLGPWPRTLVLPLGCAGIGIGAQLVTPKGHPVDLNNFQTIIQSFAASPAQRGALRRRFRKLGYELQFSTN